METLFTIETLKWVLRQPAMYILYAFVIWAITVERVESYRERKMFMKKRNRALSYIGRIKLNWVKANTNQRNILYGLDFMKRVFDRGISDAIQVANTAPDSVEQYMNKIHDELLDLCATPSAKVLLDEIFDA